MLKLLLRNFVSYTFWLVQNSLFHSIGKAKTETVGLNGEIETLSKILISLNGDKYEDDINIEYNILICLYYCA